MMKQGECLYNYGPISKPLPKRLRLGYLMNILSEGLILARREQLHYAAFLLLEKNWNGIYDSRGL
jgi:hypothetical protein